MLNDHGVPQEGGEPSVSHWSNFDTFTHVELLCEGVSGLCA